MKLDTKQKPRSMLARKQFSDNRIKYGNDDSDIWLFLKELADWLPFSERKIRGLVERKKIPFHKPPGTSQLLFNKAEINEWLRSPSQ